MSQPLSRYRYAFGKTEPAPRRDLRTPPEAVVASFRDTQIFGAMIERLQLEVEECAAAWQVAPQELKALIAGRSRFTTTDDLDATLKQLWLWHMEKRGLKLASATGGTWAP